MADIIIDATQYKNLKITYSEKNNIDNIKGTEYRVLGTEVINFDFEKGNPLVDSDGKIKINYVEHTDNMETPSTSFLDINGNPVSDSIITPMSSSLNVPNYDTNNILRTENYILKGTFRAYTDQAIQDVDSISASATIKYNTYHKEITDPNAQFLSGKNMHNTSINPTYEFLRKPSYQENREQDSDGNWQIIEQSTETAIPSQNSYFRRSALGFVQIDFFSTYKNLIALNEISKPRLVNYEGGTMVEVDYKITIWQAYNTVFVSDWAFFGSLYYYNYYLNNVTDIEFKVQANGVSTANSEFKYGDGQFKEYELETNELMQYEQNQSYETRQSYLTAQKMLDKTQLNRIIASFDLLKCDKIVEKEVGVDTDGNPLTILSYLDTGDLIKLKDENDNFVGQYYDNNGEIVVPYFEVISRHAYWDGAYHIEIVCKQQL